jgi:hypothetical protein
MSGTARLLRRPRVAVAAAVAALVVALAGAAAAALAPASHGTAGGGPAKPAAAQPDAPRGPAEEADVDVAAAGDIACDPAATGFRDGRGTARGCHQRQVSDLLVGTGLTAVLALGDNQYRCGGLDAYRRSYGPTWGRVKDMTLPVAGNHEYLDEEDPDSASTGCDPSNRGASGYFRYFGRAAGDPSQGWYSTDVGAWHVVALNSNCSRVGGCDEGSPQLAWLRADLAAHPAACTLAFWHAPAFSSGHHGGSSRYRAFWDVLYEHGAELVLNGHDHVYERFAPQAPDGTPDPDRGVREFVVGTGGANHTPVEHVRPNSEVRDDESFGVLRLTLRARGYAWEFVREAGSPSGFTDAGHADCHTSRGTGAGARASGLPGSSRTHHLNGLPAAGPPPRGSGVRRTRGGRGALPTGR